MQSASPRTCMHFLNLFSVYSSDTIKAVKQRQTWVEAAILPLCLTLQAAREQLTLECDVPVSSLIDEEFFCPIWRVLLPHMKSSSAPCRPSRWEEHCHRNRRNFHMRFNFMYFILLAESMKFISSIRNPCTYTSVCDTALTERKFIVY